MEPSDQPRVLSADGDLLAIYKPSGWVSHGTGMEGESRLDEWVELATSTSGQTPIHRLDKPVSGLVLFSADAQMRARIGALFTHRETQKKYTALVHGRTRRKGNLKRGLKDPRRGQVLDARVVVLGRRVVGEDPFHPVVRLVPRRVAVRSGGRVGDEGVE